MNRRFPDKLSILYVLGGLAAFTAALAVSCSKAPPTAPSGSTLTLTVNPTSVATSTGSASAIATLRLPNGTPQPGAQVQFTTTLGSLAPAIATTDNSGTATSRLTGDGRIGTAMVEAFSGAVMSSAVSVNLGTEAASLSLQAVPATIDQSGGTIHLLAVVRDAQGNPVIDSPVNFTTAVGSLQSGGGFVFTDSAGTARDTLKVSSTDLSNITGSNFTVSVSGAGASTAATFMVTIARPPHASFTFATTLLTVVFTDTSTNNPTSWLWDFGDNSPKSTAQNPVHTYGAAGTYAVTLTVGNGTGQTSLASAAVTVTTNQ